MELALRIGVSDKLVSGASVNDLVQSPLRYEQIQRKKEGSVSELKIDKAYESCVFEKNCSTYVQTQVRKSRLSDYKLVRVHKVFTSPNNNSGFDVTVRDLRITYYKGKKMSYEQTFRFVSRTGNIQESLAKLAELKSKSLKAGKSQNYLLN